MDKNSDTQDRKKREKVQQYFWNIVGAVEHINLPKLEDAIKKKSSTLTTTVLLRYKSS